MNDKNTSIERKCAMSEKTSGNNLDLYTVAQKLGVKFDMDDIKFDMVNMDELLVTASRKGEFDCVEFLVKNGADVHAPGDGHLEVVRFLKNNFK